MSRTSRRVSRPLIAVLAIVIVLGVAFTVHKVRKSHAQVAKASTPAATSSPAPLTPAAVLVTKPPQPQSEKTAAPAAPAPTPVPAAPAVSTPPVDATALVTQTPTEKVSTSKDATPSAGSAEENDSSANTTTPSSAPNLTSPASPSTPAQPVVADANTPASDSAPNDSKENDAASLEQWAKGGAKTPGAGTVATPSAVTSVSQGAGGASVPAQVNLSPESLADAKAKLAAGDLIGARQILNDNLIAGRGDAEALKQQIEQINQTLIFSAKKFPDDPWGGSYQVAGGERLGSIANRNSVTWDLLARINNVTPRKLRQGQWIKIAKGPFYAVVTKHSFKMDLYLGAPGGPGSMFVRTFMVGLGKDNSTPTGLWMCKAGDKIRNPRYYPSRGGDIIAPDDPKNPLGGYWIAIEGLDGQAVGKESYGIHGTIEPDSIGKMSSQGCIRLRSEDISWVFDLLVDGKSKVLVKD
ncbi:MAG TPA: L,D-transpeptidase family protein [Tepidisphaeraceae bacterium]|jgi:lipoprotein-anchoring transpeptidase ErfK/SrfK